jgi:hypothetical protein
LLGLFDEQAQKYSTAGTSRAAADRFMSPLRARPIPTRLNVFRCPSSFRVGQIVPYPDRWVGASPSRRGALRLDAGHHEGDLRGQEKATALRLT